MEKMINNEFKNLEKNEILQQVKNSVRDILMEYFKGNGVDKNVIDKYNLIDELGMDSVAFIYLIIAFEAKFGIEFPDDYILIEKFKNVDMITNTIVDILASSLKQEKQNE